MLNYNKIELSILNQTESNTKKVLEKIDLKYIHIDIMDWYFVKNLSNINPFFMKNLNLENYKLHLHFMVEEVDIFFEYYKDFKNIESVSFHIESNFYKNWKVLEFINYLKNRGIKVWLAINPNTWIDKFSTEGFSPLHNLENIDFFQIMTVIPWLWWQSFIPEMEEKIINLRKIYNKEIFIDWWVNKKIYKKLENRVDRFIIGSYLYK